MTRFYYRHLELDPALAWVGDDGYTVWYYPLAQPVAPETVPPPWTNKDDRPPNATAVVVASTDKNFSDGTCMGDVERGPQKDPLPPPPPPPYFSDLVDYLKQSDVHTFFHPDPDGATARDFAV